MAQNNGPRTFTQQMRYEDISPSSDWTHDSNCHVLLIDLHGFKKEELKVRVDNFGKVTVSGERRVDDTKCHRFKQVFTMPDDSDVEKIKGRFDEGVLFVVIPRKKEEPKKVNEIEELKQNEKTRNEILKKNESIEQNDHHDSKKDNLKQDDVGRKYFKDAHQGVEQIKDRVRNDLEAARTKVQGAKEGIKSDANQTLTKIKGTTDGIREDSTEALARVQGAKDSLRKDLTETFTNAKEAITGARTKEWRKEDLEMLVKNAADKINNNKSYIITAVLAVSIGLYLSRKLRAAQE